MGLGWKHSANTVRRHLQPLKKTNFLVKKRMYWSTINAEGTVPEQNPVFRGEADVDTGGNPSARSQK